MKQPYYFMFLLLSASIASNAQTDGVQPVFFVGGGPSFTTNHFNNYVKHGFNLSGGGGVRIGLGIELLGEFNYNELGVQEEVIQSLQVPDANARIYSVTGNVKFPFTTGRLRPYAIIGGGWYRRTVEFTEPSTGLVTILTHGGVGLDKPPCPPIQSLGRYLVTLAE